MVRFAGGQFKSELEAFLAYRFHGYFGGCGVGQSIIRDCFADIHEIQERNCARVCAVPFPTHQ